MLRTDLVRRHLKRAFSLQELPETDSYYSTQLLHCYRWLFPLGYHHLYHQRWFDLCPRVLAALLHHSETLNLRHARSASRMKPSDIPASKAGFRAFRFKPFERPYRWNVLHRDLSICSGQPIRALFIETARI
jgi:hypothetical protein